MKFKDFVENLNKLLTNETAEMEVYQSSCFDAPLAFTSDGAYVGSVWMVTDNDMEEIFISEKDAEYRIKDAPDDYYETPKITKQDAIVISGY